jgi:hypothetical protein
MRGGPSQEYLDAYLARHRAPATRLLTLVGNGCFVLGAVVAALRRDRSVLIGGLAAGAVMTGIAHLFQPGTLCDELFATLRHPAWAVRSEIRRVAGP